MSWYCRPPKQARPRAAMDVLGFFRTEQDGSDLVVTHGDALSASGGLLCRHGGAIIRTRGLRRERKAVREIRKLQHHASLESN